MTVSQQCGTAALNENKLIGLIVKISFKKTKLFHCTDNCTTSGIYKAIVRILYI